MKPDLLDRTIARIVPADEVPLIRQGMRDSLAAFRTRPLAEAKRWLRAFSAELLK